MEIDFGFVVSFVCSILILTGAVIVFVIAAAKPKRREPVSDHRKWVDDYKAQKLFSDHVKRMLKK